MQRWRQTAPNPNRCPICRNEVEKDLASVCLAPLISAMAESERQSRDQHQAMKTNATRWRKRAEQAETILQKRSADATHWKKRADQAELSLRVLQNQNGTSIDQQLEKARRKVENLERAATILERTAPSWETVNRYGARSLGQQLGNANLMGGMASANGAFLHGPSEQDQLVRDKQSIQHMHPGVFKSRITATQATSMQARLPARLSPGLHLTEAMLSKQDRDLAIQEFDYSQPKLQSAASMGQYFGSFNDASLGSSSRDRLVARKRSVLEDGQGSGLTKQQRRSTSTYAMERRQGQAWSDDATSGVQTPYNDGSLPAISHGLPQLAVTGSKDNPINLTGFT